MTGKVLGVFGEIGQFLPHSFLSSHPIFWRGHFQRHFLVNVQQIRIEPEQDAFFELGCCFF